MVDGESFEAVVLEVATLDMSAVDQDEAVVEEARATIPSNEKMTARQHKKDSKRSKSMKRLMSD